MKYVSQDTFTFHGFCDYPNCHFEVSEYRSPNNIYIGIVSDDEGPICSCTVNIPRLLPEGQISIKDWSENEGMDIKLHEMKIIEGEPVDCELSGFVTIDIYELGEKGKQLIEEYRKEQKNE